MGGRGGGACVMCVLLCAERTLKKYCTWNDFIYLFIFCNTKLEGNISRLKLWVGTLFGFASVH